MKAAKKQSNLKIVQAKNLSGVSDERHSKWQQENEPWEKAEKGWRITYREARQRVRILREELESYQAQMEGVPFDIPYDDCPFSLNYKRKYVTDFVEDINPFVSGFFEMIDAYAKEHSTHEFLDFQAKLFALKRHATETGFKIGVLAGAIFGGCSKDTVDRFERGLGFSLESDPEVTE